MAKILAIETSSQYGGVALIDGENLLAEANYLRKAGHGQSIHRLIAEVCKEGNLELNDLDALAVSNGPGSFTALRIGLATAKGLAYGLNKKLVVLNSLQLLASNVPYFENSLLVPTISIRQGELSALLCRQENQRKITVVQQLEALPFKDYLTLLQKQQQQMIFFGLGARLYRQQIIAELENKAIFLNALYDTVRPAALAYLALEKVIAEDFSDPFEVKPIYLGQGQVRT